MKRILFILSLLLLPGINSLKAASDSSHEIKRRVLALYKSSEGDSPASNQIVEFLEHPMDVLGLVTDYWDIDQGFPEPSRLTATKAIMSFYRGQEISDPETYAAWIATQAKEGRKVLIFGDYGAFINRKTKAFAKQKTIQQAFGAIGLEYRGYSITDKSLVSLHGQDSSMMGFEEPLHSEEVAPYVWIKSLDPRNISYLSLTRKDVPESLSSPVIITPQGAHALGDYLLYEYVQNGEVKQRWHLDPYRFLAKALGGEQNPRMDFATLNGRRLLIASIDGDGFTTPSRLGRSCGEVIEESILNVYKFPILASFITSELHKYPMFQEIAKRIVALPHVEPASHTATHPLDWHKSGLNIQTEVEGSLAYLNKKIVPENKPAVVITWSGLSNPPAKAFQALEHWGGYNINGPQTAGGFQHRFDRNFPSRTHLSPLVYRVGKYLQFQHLAANDFSLTNSWKNDLGGYEDILQTWQKTSQNPELPVHAYFHWYSGEDSRSLEALKKAFAWMESQPLAPVHVTEYNDMVRDFRTARIWKDSAGRTRIQNNGRCRTIVFPGEKRFVDMQISRNVLGSTVRQGNLYVFLDENSEHLVAFSKTESPAPRLLEASGWVEGWMEHEGRIHFTVRAHGQALVELGSLEKGRYEIFINPKNNDLSGQKQVLKPSDNRLTISYFAHGQDTVEITPVGPARSSFLQAGPAAMTGCVASFSFWFLWKRRREREHAGDLS